MRVHRCAMHNCKVASTQDGRSIAARRGPAVARLCAQQVDVLESLAGMTHEPVSGVQALVCLKIDLFHCAQPGAAQPNCYWYYIHTVGPGASGANKTDNMADW